MNEYERLPLEQKIKIQTAKKPLKEIAEILNTCVDNVVALVAVEFAAAYLEALKEVESDE